MSRQPSSSSTVVIPPADAQADGRCTAAPPTQDPGTMAELRRRTLFLLAILGPAIGLTLVLVLAQRRETRIADLAEKAIPATIVAPDRVWTSTSMKFSDAEMEILETRDYVF